MTRPQPTSEANADMRGLIHAQATAWADGDADAVAGAFSDPCEFVAPGMRLTHPREVRQAAEDHLARYKDIHVDVGRIISDGDSAAVEWTWTDTNRETGSTARIQDAIVLRVTNGQLVYWREYLDCTVESGGSAAGTG